MYRIADYVADAFVDAGIELAFMVTGGAAMHLDDALGAHPSLSVFPMHHEQGCAIAAEGYARVSGRPAVVCVTAGPGGINALNGVFGAFVDSIPMVVVSGQAKRSTMVANSGIQGLRQLGDQEVDIVAMAGPVTKYAVVLSDPTRILAEVQKALRMAVHGRPGPVWLDIPSDIQAMEYVADIQVGPEEVASVPDWRTVEPALMELAEHLSTARRPVLYVGSGIRLSRSIADLHTFLERWGIPVVTAWNSNDLIADDHPNYAGRPGTVGTRAGNFAVQCADCVVVLGARLNLRLVSFNYEAFADKAWICHVDVDRAELDKPTLRSSLKIQSDLRGLLPALDDAMVRVGVAPRWGRWREWCRKNVLRYPVGSTVSGEGTGVGVNPYDFVRELTRRLPDEAVTVCGDGTACVVGFQAAIIKQGQRLFHNSGCASMGYDLPAAIGAHLATNRPVVCLAGDGSLMMNIQELAIVAGRALPIIVFVLNNEGYHSIRQTQRNYFPGRVVGCGPESGLPFPDFVELGRGFGIESRRATNITEVQKILDESLERSKPLLVDIQLDMRQEFAPKTSSRKLADGSMITARLEDMAPFLPAGEVASVVLEALAI